MLAGHGSSSYSEVAYSEDCDQAQSGAASGSVVEEELVGTFSCCNYIKACLQPAVLLQYRLQSCS